MKQRKLSYILKGVVITLAILGILYIVGLPLAAERMDVAAVKNTFWGFYAFRWWTLFFCYIILFLFWKVCTQIGVGNSFSLENATAFHRIAICGGGIILGFAFEFIWALIRDYLTAMSLIFILFKVVVFIIFIVICEALSQLILNAYEIRQENELTI